MPIRSRLLMLVMSAALLVVAMVVGVIAQNPPMRKIALLIGNQKYLPSVGQLTNPHVDVDRLQSVLKASGFEVVVRLDRNVDQLDKDIDDFLARLKVLGPNTMALVYYSGHGASDGEGGEARNYLIPVDYTPQKSLKRQAVAMTEVMEKLKGVPSKARVVIIDACRNKAYEKSVAGSGKGLVVEETPVDMLVVYATSAGRIAVDSGVFAATLAEEVPKPGDVGATFKRVQRVVAKRTANGQVPELRDQLLTEDVCFRNCKGAADGSAPRQYDSGLAEDYFWTACCTGPNAKSKEGAEDYLKQVKNGMFPGQYRERAEERISGSPPPTRPQESFPISTPALPKAYQLGKIPSSVKEMPWFATLEDSASSFFCGGSAISSEWILTAGHCGEALQQKLQSGSLGLATIGRDTRATPAQAQAHKIVQVIVHPQFKSEFKGGIKQPIENDVAVVRIASPWKGPVASLTPRDMGDPTAGIVTAFGFGTVDFERVVIASNLHAAWMPLVSNSRCLSAHSEVPRIGVIDGRTICAGYEEGGADSCTGDAGGPLVGWSKKSPVLIGVTSWGGSPCGKPRNFGVYMRVSAYADWIQRVTGVKLQFAK